MDVEYGKASAVYYRYHIHIKPFPLPECVCPLIGIETRKTASGVIFTRYFSDVSDQQKTPDDCRYPPTGITCDQAQSMAAPGPISCQQ